MGKSTANRRGGGGGGGVTSKHKHNSDFKPGNLGRIEALTTCRGGPLPNTTVAKLNGDSRSPSISASLPSFNHPTQGQTSYVVSGTNARTPPADS